MSKLDLNEEQVEKLIATFLGVDVTSMEVTVKELEEIYSQYKYFFATEVNNGGDGRYSLYTLIIKRKSDKKYFKLECTYEPIGGLHIDEPFIEITKEEARSFRQWNR